jgi:hypothetical protein
MYFVGLHFLYSMTSATLIGIGRDAERIAKAISLRTRLEGHAGRLRQAEGRELGRLVA